uniref:Uncharacterized protein n=1 Tax=Amphimedon queenslandica TaxID=400682 RepID=A0A1X7SKA5_AMPQE
MSGSQSSRGSSSGPGSSDSGFPGEVISAPAPSDDERFEHFRHISKKRNNVENPNTASQPFSGFFDDDEFNYFGILKKTEKRPLSNFRFTLKFKVSSVVPSSTGYIVEVYAEDDGD